MLTPRPDDLGNVLHGTNPHLHTHEVVSNRRRATRGRPLRRITGALDEQPVDGTQPTEPRGELRRGDTGIPHVVEAITPRCTATTHHTATVQLRHGGVDEIPRTFDEHRELPGRGVMELDECRHDPNGQRRVHLPVTHPGAHHLVANVPRDTPGTIQTQHPALHTHRLERHVQRVAPLQLVHGIEPVGDERPGVPHRRNGVETSLAVRLSRQESRHCVISNGSWVGYRYARSSSVWVFSGIM